MGRADDDVHVRDVVTWQVGSGADGFGIVVSVIWGSLEAFDYGNVGQCSGDGVVSVCLYLGELQH